MRLAFFLNLGFALVEVVGGFWTNSLAIIADALHDLGDSLALGLSWYFLKLSERGRSPEYSYGYRRFSLLGALVNSLLLTGGAVWVLVQAATRLANPEPSDAPKMVLLALAGVAVNGFAAWRMRRESGLAAESVSWHLWEDVLGWTAVLIVSVILLFADVWILDPLLSIGITLFVLYNVVRNLRRVAVVFLQAVPEGMDANDLERRFRELPRVRAAHHTHVWSLDGEHHVLTTHVVLDADATREDVLAVKRGIKELIDADAIRHITVEVELEGEPCAMDSPTGCNYDH